MRVADSVDGIRDAAVLATGTLAVPGYHSVAFADAVSVAAGQRLVIAVRLTTPGYWFPIAVERPYAGYADTTAGPGQSYVSGDGVSWTDMTALIAGTDVCLKGLRQRRADPAPDPAASPTPPELSPAPEPSANP